MDITGKIIAVLPERSGVSARTGNEWKSQEFVIETHEQYPKKMVFRVFGSERLSRFNIKAGDEKTVSFDINAREWQGRWFNDIDAWNVVAADPNAANAGGPIPTVNPIQPAAAPAAPTAQAASTEPFPQADTASTEDGSGDLPF